MGWRKIGASRLRRNPDRCVARTRLGHSETGYPSEQSGARRENPIRALHIGEVQSLYLRPIDLAFVCVKLYDTGWAVALIAPYLSPSGYMVTLQNGLIEERIAAVVGWERTVGCVGAGMYVGLNGAGHVVRTRQTGKSGSKIFYVGEVHGRETPRVHQLVEMLGHVGASACTGNLRGMRWSKLVPNTMTSALCAARGLSLKEIFSDLQTRQVMLRLAAEAISVGAALGYAIEPVFGLAADRWVAANASDACGLAEVNTAFHAQFQLLTEAAVSGIAQDVKKGRRTEFDYMNGYIAARAAETALAAPSHATLTTLIKKWSAVKPCLTGNPWMYFGGVVCESKPMIDAFSGKLAYFSRKSIAIRTGSLVMLTDARERRIKLDVCGSQRIGGTKVQVSEPAWHLIISSSIAAKLDDVRIYRSEILGEQDGAQGLHFVIEPGDYLFAEVRSVLNRGSTTDVKRRILSRIRYPVRTAVSLIKMDLLNCCFCLGPVEIT